jgi:hypothetical protein
MPNPETAALALAQWDARRQLEAVRLGQPSTNQAQMWARVFDILRAMPEASAAGTVSVSGRTGASVREGGWNATSNQQFDTMCWKNSVGFPKERCPACASTIRAHRSITTPVPGQSGPCKNSWHDEQALAAAEWTEARAMAYSIIREGYAMVITRKKATGSIVCLIQKP